MDTNKDTTEFGLRVAQRWLHGISSDFDQHELHQKSAWAFGGGMVASSMGATEASYILFDLCDGLGRIAYDFTDREAARVAIQELKSKLEQEHDSKHQA